MRSAWDEATHFAGFKTRLGIIGFSITLMTIAVHWNRVGQSAAQDEISIFQSTVHATLYVFAAIYAICLLRAPWKSDDKQRETIKSQAKTIENLQSGNDPCVLIVLNKKDNIERVADNRLLYRISVDLKNSGSTSRMWCQLQSIEAVDQQSISQMLRRFRGRFLLERHHDDPPRQERAMDAGADVRFDLIGETESEGTWHLCLATTDEMHPLIPAGHYRLTVAAGGSHLKPDTKVFEARTNPSGRLMVTVQ